MARFTRTQPRSKRFAFLAIAKDERGAIATEYAVVIGVCAIVVAAALASLGAAIVTSYQGGRTTLMSPTP